MANYFPTLEQARSQLADAVLDRGREVPNFAPMNIHPWLAMSLMQKAIRRGREDLALRASASLLRTSPDRFWRRISVTAFEDIGVANVETVAIVTAALKGKRWRADLGGEWPVASYLVERMSRTVKCRAADDLAVVCQWHSSLKHSHSVFADKSPLDLLNGNTQNGKFLTQALAVWYATGTRRCRSPVLPECKGDIKTMWEYLIHSGVPATAVEVAQEGLRKSNSILCPFVSLLWPKLGAGPNDIQKDNWPKEEMIGDVPCWAFDVHVREGTQALSRFLRSDCNTSRWITQHIPRDERFRVLGSMLFRIESGMVDNRFRWEMGSELRHMADLETGGVEERKMQEGLALLRNDLPTLNHERRYVWANAPKNAQLSISGIKP